jgi:hypothetical protein
MLVRLLHSLGLTNLSDQQLASFYALPPAIRRRSFAQLSRCLAGTTFGIATAASVLAASLLILRPGPILRPPELAINESIRRIEETTGTLAAQSEQWQRSLNDLSDELQKHGRTDLAAQVREYGATSLAYASGEEACSSDFFRKRLEQFLRNLEVAVREKRTEIQHVPAAICLVRPRQVDMKWHFPASFYPSTSRIEAIGYGLDKAKEDGIRLLVISEDGKRRDETAALHVINAHKVDMTLGEAGLHIQMSDRTLVLGNQEGTFEIPCVWPGPMTHVASPEQVVEIRIDYYTTDDDKDAEDTVKHSIIANNVEVSAASYDGRIRWPDHTGPEPYGRRAVGLFVLPVVDQAARTFKLSQPVEPGKKIPGRLTVSKTPTDQGWHFRVELYGKTNKGRVLRYDHDWNDRFRARHQLQAWDFTW